MGYPPEPPPERSELRERHELQCWAQSIGYVAVPETVWDQLTAVTVLVKEWAQEAVYPADSHLAQVIRFAKVALATATQTNERIRQERE